MFEKFQLSVINIYYYYNLPLFPRGVLWSPTAILGLLLLGEGGIPHLSHESGFHPPMQRGAQIWGRQHQPDLDLWQSRGLGTGRIHLCPLVAYEEYFLNRIGLLIIFDLLSLIIVIY